MTELMDVDVPPDAVGPAAAAAPYGVEPGPRGDGPLPIPPDKAVLAPPGFDLETYASRYTGNTKHQRLLLIAESSPDLQLDAYRLLLQDLRKGTNTRLYSKLSKELGAHLVPPGSNAWVEETDRRCLQLQETLEAELNQNRKSVQRDLVRQSFAALGEFHNQRGDFVQAMKCFVRARDYCSSNEQLAMTSLDVIQIAVDSGNFSQVSSCLSKVEHIADSLFVDLSARFKATSGLMQLRNRQYKMAARRFLATSPILGDHFSNVLVAEDVALYGGVCVLATFDRDELKSQVIEGGDFKNFLDLVPNMRQLVQDVHESRYGKALQALQAMRPAMLLDLHLRDHVDQLFGMVRDRCLTQYFSPYLSVSLHSMAAAFATPVDEIEASMAKLIVDGHIAARIDSQAKTVHTREREKRAATYEKAFAMGENYLREMRSMLLRMSCLEQELIVAGRPSMAGALGGGGSGDGDGLGGGAAIPDIYGAANQQDSGDAPVQPPPEANRAV